MTLVACSVRWLAVPGYVLVCAVRTVVQPLLTGDEVVPETFPSATIYFSSIDGFMQYTESSSAHQVTRSLTARCCCCCCCCFTACSRLVFSFVGEVAYCHSDRFRISTVHLLTYETTVKRQGTDKSFQKVVSISTRNLHSDKRYRPTKRR